MKKSYPKRGFASMDKDLQREIAGKGGRQAWLQGKAHCWTEKEAQAAGRKGGLASQANRRKRLAEQSQS